MELHEIQMRVSISTVVLESSMLIHCLIIYGCFHTKTAKLKSCNRDHMACKA